MSNSNKKSWTVFTEGIPDIVKQYSFAKEDHILGKVVRHRIVVATCSTSGALYKLDLSEGHFTHCFVDEAGKEWLQISYSIEIPKNISTKWTVIKIEVNKAKLYQEATFFIMIFTYLK